MVLRLKFFSKDSINGYRGELGSRVYANRILLGDLGCERDA